MIVKLPQQEGWAVLQQLQHHPHAGPLRRRIHPTQAVMVQKNFVLRLQLIRN